MMSQDTSRNTTHRAGVSSGARPVASPGAGCLWLLGSDSTRVGARDRPVSRHSRRPYRCCGERDSDGRQAMDGRVTADGSRQPREPLLPIPRQPPLGRPDRHSGLAGRPRQRHVLFKMRLKHGKALHSHLALRLGERDDGRRLAVACHAGLSACLRRRCTGGGAITIVCAPSPPQARNTPASPKK